MKNAKKKTKQETVHHEGFSNGTVTLRDRFPPVGCTDASWLQIIPRVWLEIPYLGCDFGAGVAISISKKKKKV